MVERQSSDDGATPLRRSRDEQAQIEQRFASMADRQPLHGGGGGGTSDSMEPRIARLEKQADQLVKDVSDLRIDVATLKENVRHLPTKPWIFTTLAGMLTVFVAIVGLLIRFLPKAG